MCEGGKSRPLVNSYKAKIIMSTVIAITTAIKKYIGFGIGFVPSPLLLMLLTPFVPYKVGKQTADSV